jgi:hypothetical protein
MPENIPTPSELADTKILVLIQGVLESGAQHYAYLSVPFLQYAEFKQAEAAGHYNPEDFGVILRHGEGAPSPEVVAMMQETHGVDHQFEENMAIVFD